MNRNIKQYVSLELRNYANSLAELEQLKLEIKFLRKAPAMKYNSEKLELMTYRFEYLERITTTITKVVENLEPELHRLFMAKYMTKPQRTDKELMEQLYVGRTSFYKDDATIAQLVAKRLGLK